jgi:ABC-type branched-subunit amino acid transport system ATPase component/branched-subunit amino acid ABC-type transport system permease component
LLRLAASAAAVIHVNFLLLGLGNGAVFAALALALVVTYRSSGVLNFATGALSLYAAYTYAFLRQGVLLILIPGLPKSVRLASSLGFVPAFAITLALQALLGAVLYVAIFRPLRNHRVVAKAVASLGVLTLLTAAADQRVGTQQVLVSSIFPTHTYTIGGIHVIGDRLWFAVTIVGVALGLSLVYRYTRFGLATRAVAETEEGALVSGLSPDRIALSNWAISAVIAGVAGVLISPLVSLLPGTYTLFIVPALAAAVLGRFSSIMPAVFGGLAIGMLQSEAVFLQSRYTWMPQSGTAELIPLILVLVVLVVRGRPLPTRGSLLQQTLGRAPRPKSLLVPLAVGVSAGVAAVLVLQGNDRAALITSLIFAVIALSLVVITGLVGQVSLAQLTLAGTAGFLLSTLGYTWGIPFPIAPILAAAGATVIGVVVGLPALRIRGILVAVVTLIFAVAIEAFWFENNDLDGGSGGKKIPTPRLFGINLGIGKGTAYPRAEFGLLCLVVLTLVAIGVAKLRTSRLGSAMLAVRANERSAAAAGISVVRVKLVGFGIAAFIAGLGGCLIAYQQTNVTFQSFDALAGLGLFTVAFLAGITSVSGGILAGLIAADGLLLAWLNRAVSVGDWYGILSGIGVIIVVIVNPEGVIGAVHDVLDRRYQARAAAKDASSPRGSPGELPARESTVASPTTEPSTVLSVTSLTVRYGGVVALDDVGLSVGDGTIVGLIGPNGAGKTTMIDALCGFATYAGDVRLAGESLAGLSPHRRAQLGLGRTFQGVDLYDDLTVEENVVVGVNAAPRKRHARVKDVLSVLDLTTIRHRNVGELSTGRRQLVSIARALAGQPRLLLLDEPAAGLDTSESEWLADRLRQLPTRGVTILLVDHDMGFVMGLCDQIFVLDFGTLIAAGQPAEIRTNRQVASAYLGSTHAQEASSS